MRRGGCDEGARGGVRDGMATAGATGASLFMMQSSFSAQASSWMTTPVKTTRQPRPTVHRRRVPSPRGRCHHP